MNKEEILQELEIEIQKILAPYFIVLDGRDSTQENEELIEISKRISSNVSENYISKAEVKEKIEKEKLYNTERSRHEAVVSLMKIENQLGLDK